MADIIKLQVKRKEKRLSKIIKLILDHAKSLNW
jgi:hypothetical protein